MVIFHTVENWASWQERPGKSWYDIDDNCKLRRATSLSKIVLVVI